MKPIQLNFNFNKKIRAFSLIELLLGIGILAIIFTLVLLIIIPLLQATPSFLLKMRVRSEMNQLSNFIFKKIFNSKSAYPLDYGIALETDQGIEWIRMAKPAQIMDNDLYGFGWNPRIGYLSLSCENFTSDCSSYKVIKNQSDYQGWAWSPVIGWIKFNSTTPEACSPPITAFRVCEDSEGNLHGWAWNDIIGWISFNCQNQDSCNQSNYSVQNKNNFLTGYAWNDVAGWIVFNGRGGYATYRTPGGAEFRITSNKVVLTEMNFQKVGIKKPAILVKLKMYALERNLRFENQNQFTVQPKGK